MKKVALFLSVILLFTALTGCGPDKGEASVQSVSMICGMGSVGLADRFAGMVTPHGETNIKVNEGSEVAEVLVEVGNDVIAGQPLFRYDMAQSQLELERAQLELEKLKNTLTAYDEQKKEITKSDNTKWYDFLLNNAAQNSTAQDTAKQSKESQLDLREIDVLILQAKYDISVKEKEIEKLINTVNNVTVTAPVSGVIQAINENGAMDDFGNPLPFMTIVETGGCRIKGYINENSAAALSEGMEVLLRSRVSEQVWHGTVSEIDWNNPEQNSSNYGYSDDDTVMSSKYPFYVVLEDSSGLMMGQHVYIEPDYGQDAIADANAIHLPAWYICDADSNPYVWAQGGSGKLEKRNITLGDYDEMMDTYVVESGLTAQDYIAFPEENLTVGMTCVTYDESNFADGDMPAEDMGGMDYAMPEMVEEDVLMMEETA